MVNAEIENEIAAKDVGSIRILVADDHEVMRLGLRNLVEARAQWKVCGEASNGREAVEKAIQLRPDVVILDIAMPTMNGLEAAAHIAADHPEIPIILFSLHLSEELMKSLRAGPIRGAVSKSEAGRDLVEAIDTVLRGGTFFDGKSLPGKQCRSRKATVSP